MTAFLLAACGQTNPPDDALPTVPLAVRPSSPNCSAVARSALHQVGLGKISGVNDLPRHGLRAQAFQSNNLYELLLDTRLLVNQLYYGFSTVDRQALHAQYEAAFRQARGNLVLAPIDDAVDGAMIPYLNGMNDEHTYSLDLAAATAYRAARDGSSSPRPLFGVGLAALPTSDGGVLTVLRYDGPMYLAGLRRGDVLTSVDGQLLTRVDTSGTADGDAANVAAYAKILAAAAARNVPVTVQYLHKGQPQTVSVQAKIINAVALPYGSLLPNSTHYVLTFPTFGGEGIAQRIHALVADAKSKGATDIIIDLRDNGGGRVSEFVGSAAAFAPDQAGEILEDITADDVTFRYDKTSGAVNGSSVCSAQPYVLKITQPASWTGKTVILTTQGSASASELFSQVLRLGGNTHIIGEKTTGVGNTFTYIVDVSGGRDISVTAGRGKMLNGQYAAQFVTPDEAVPDDLTALAAGEDKALNAALKYLGN